MQLLSLNKTCRYCPHCDLLIAHQDDVEHLLASIFTELRPEIVGNTYLVVGTLDKTIWKRTFLSLSIFWHSSSFRDGLKTTVTFRHSPSDFTFTHRRKAWSIVNTYIPGAQLALRSGYTTQAIDRCFTK
jgi:hypothetical protein